MSKREDIITEVMATLGAITSGGGYNFTPSEALREYKHYNKVPSYPAFYFEKADEDRDNETNLEFVSDMSIFIVGYVKATNSSDEELLSKQLDRLISDATKALNADTTRGGLAKYTEIQKIITDAGFYTPIAGFEMEILVQYRATFATP